MPSVCSYVKDLIFSFFVCIFVCPFACLVEIVGLLRHTLRFVPLIAPRVLSL